MPRRLLFAVLIAGLVVAGLPPPARADVDAITVTTDRAEYVAGMTVIATGVFVYNTGPFSRIDTLALFEWFNASWVPQASEWVPKVDARLKEAEATASWVPPWGGTYHVNVTSNRSVLDTTPVTATTSFLVWPASGHVIALGIAVATDRSLYERLETVTATATPTPFFGNMSRLERVEFNWTYPSGAPARLRTVPVANGSAVDAWAADQVGTGYTINATYVGNDTVWDNTTFTIVPITTPATNVSAGQTVTWDVARSPWRVCGDVFVNQTGTLVIEPNTTVRFCRGSRLVVRGTLTGDGSPSAPVTFTSLEFPPAPGDWNGLWFEDSASSRLVRAVVEYAADGVVSIGGGPALVGLVARAGSGEAVRFVNASGTLQDASVTGFGRGVHLVNATTLVQNLTVSGATREGVVVEGDSSGLLVRDVRVTGGNQSLKTVSASGLRIEGASFSGAAQRAVDLTASTVTLANASIATAGGGLDFLLVASTATLVNSTFLDDAARRTLITPSRLVVQNFLAVSVATTAGAPLAGARVNVTVNGVPRAERTTDASGVAAWILVEDRVHNATATVKNVVSIAVSRGGFTIAGSPRTVDMAASHLESFVATPVADGTDGGFLEVTHFALLGIAVLFLSALLLLWRRRARKAAGEGPLPGGPPKPMPPVETVPGRSYAVLAEKPHEAFERFVADVRAGTPGLCITRIRPEDAQERYGLKGVPIYWLSRSFGKETLNPTNLGAIVEIVRKRTAGKPGSVVLLDGVEYLYTQNDFGKVVKFVQALADVVAEQKAVLLLPLDPQTLDPDRLAVLMRDLTPWR